MARTPTPTKIAGDLNGLARAVSELTMNASQRENPFAEDCTPDLDAWHAANNAQIYRETLTQLVAAILSNSNENCCKLKPFQVVAVAAGNADMIVAELDRRFAKEDGK